MGLHRDQLMIVATHKAAVMPNDALYYPLHVGRAASTIDIGLPGDDEGPNISVANSRYCEMTGLYWAWKNTDSNLIGLNHYRRYFKGSRQGPGGKRILSPTEAADLLQRHDFIVAKPRNYLIESVETHYRHAHIGQDLDVARQVVRELQPGYAEAFEQVMKGTRLSLANMFLAHREAFEDYARWLFPLLDECDARIDWSGRDTQEMRFVGFIAERLLNVWVENNRSEIRIGYLPIVSTEGENKIVKAWDLLKRKLNRT